MKRSTYEQFAIVHSDSASHFNKQLNEEIYRLKDNDPVVHFSESIPFYAQIKYTVECTTDDAVLEEDPSKNVGFVCAQCPFFNPVLKDDGEPDRRCKWGECEHTELGRTYKTSAACSKLYELIKEGDVKLCFLD